VSHLRITVLHRDATVKGWEKLQYQNMLYICTCMMRHNPSLNKLHFRCFNDIAYFSMGDLDMMSTGFVVR